MNKFLSILAVAATLGLGSIGAASAAGPATMAPKAATGSDLVTEVQNPCGRYGCRDPWAYGGGRHYGDSSRTYRRHWDRGDWRYRDRDRYHRRHYRPAPSFGIYIQPPVAPRYVPSPVYRQGNSHVAWCSSRYRSYRAWDNSWQPYHGPRRICVSPFG